MQTINIYQVGIDPIPPEGVRIMLFQPHSSFAMFVWSDVVEGEVIYMCGDITEAGVDEALEKGAVITTVWEDVHEWQSDDDSLFIPIAVESEDNLLVDDMKWMYSHEYLRIVDDIFPFQDWNEHTKALGLEWLTLLDRKVEDVYITDVVRYAGRKYKPQWNTCYDKPKFMGWENYEH